MEKKLLHLAITVYNRNDSYLEVNELLHRYAPSILLRVGYPMRERNLAIIFLVAEMTTDELGAFSGRLGQIPSVQVQSTTIKTGEKK